MESLIEWVLRNAEFAHWFIFGAILIAGFNIPISADILIVIGGFLAATVVPHHLWHLYFAILLGCYFSAWIAYWFGRLLGKRFCKYQWFARLMPTTRLEKIGRFYSKHGLWTLLIGRFIPFGIRNCIFMSSGMSRVSFFKFALWDLMACFVWTSVSFYVFYILGQNYQLLFNHLRTLNTVIFLASV
jgi:membrane protein DedA with SNARE-associated domain